MRTILHDARLPDALAAVLGYLSLGGRPPFEAARAAADRVVEGLARHLRREEEILKEVSDGSLGNAKEEHARLRSFAGALASRLSAADPAGAADVARDFLDVLTRHLERSEEALGRVLDRLPPAEADRVLRRAGGLRGEEDSED